MELVHMIRWINTVSRAEGAEHLGRQLQIDNVDNFVAVKSKLTPGHAHHYRIPLAVIHVPKHRRFKILVKRIVRRRAICIKALSVADKVILTTIMGSREVNTYGISSEYIAERLADAVVVDGFTNIADKIIEIADKNDIVITMGGGDIYKAAHVVQEKLG